MAEEQKTDDTESDPDESEYWSDEVDLEDKEDPEA